MCVVEEQKENMTDKRTEALALLAVASHKSPHERLMQIVFNALDQQGKARTLDGTPRDVFYVEDELLAKALFAYVRDVLE